MLPCLPTTILKLYSTILHLEKKGLVEGLVGYIRRNVYVLILRTEATDDLNRMSWKSTKAIFPTKS